MLSDEQCDSVIEAAENEVGMGHGAWDMVNPRDLVRAIESALSQSTEQGERDAALWQKLKPLYYAAHFFPQEMDFPEGVALIFLAPKGTRVSADLDSTVAAMSPHGDGGRG